MSGVGGTGTSNATASFEGEVSLSALTQTSDATRAQGFRITADNSHLDDTVLRGRMNNILAPSGLSIHVTDTTGTCDTDATWRMQAAFVVAVVLEGSLDTWLGDRPMTLGAGAEPIGQYWNLTDETPIRRRSKRGAHIRKVIIGVPREWIQTVLKDLADADAPSPDSLTQHRAIGTWRPSRHVQSLAEQLINPTQDLPVMRILSAESKATEIVYEAFRHILDANQRGEQNSDPSLTEAGRAQQVRQYILDNVATPLSLPSIAAAMGMSVGSMQSAFKSTYKLTVGAFIREQRLIAARDWIELDGKRVSEAAYLAGYDNPASFSTAFKRMFGFAPSGCRR